MVKAGPARSRLLTETERCEPTVIVACRIPRSWYRLIRKDGVISDRLLAAISRRVRSLKSRDEQNRVE